MSGEHPERCPLLHRRRTQIIYGSQNEFIFEPKERTDANFGEARLERYRFIRFRVN